MTRKNYDVVVIGGGVIGILTAFFLTKAGMKVGLIEKGVIASGTSSKTMSNLSLHNRMPGPEWDLSMETLKIYKNLDEKYGKLFEFEVTASLMLIDLEEKISWAQERVKQQQQAGLDIEYIDAKNLRELDPSVSHIISGAAYCHSSARINSLLLCYNLARATRSLGTEIFTNTAVTGILVKKGKVIGIKNTSGIINCEIVVNAAGPSADLIGKMVGINLPIKKNRGHILVTQQIPPTGIRLKGECTDKKNKFKETNIQNKIKPEKKIDFNSKYDVHMVFAQTPSGNCLIGRSGEEGKEEIEIRPEAINAIIKRAEYFIPMLSKVSIIRVFAGIRPYSPDGLPFLGELQDPKGFFLACGFGDKGVALGAAGAEKIAKSILDSSYIVPKVFDPNRFSKTSFITN